MVSSFFVFVLAITSTVIEGAPKEIPSCYELTETRGKFGPILTQHVCSNKDPSEGRAAVTGQFPVHTLALLSYFL